MCLWNKGDGYKNQYVDKTPEPLLDSVHLNNVQIHIFKLKTFSANERLGVSACNGDSGRGMFFEPNGTWYVRGIVSFTDVSKYREWIMRYTGMPKGLKES